MALEVRMESTTQKMIESLGASLTRAIATMTTQAESGREFLMAFKAQADRMQMHADRLINRNHHGTHNTPPRKSKASNAPRILTMTMTIWMMTMTWPMGATTKWTKTKWPMGAKILKQVVPKRPKMELAQ